MHKQFPRVYILAFFGVSCFTKVDTLLFVSGFQFFVFFFARIWVVAIIPVPFWSEHRKALIFSVLALRNFLQRNFSQRYDFYLK